MEGFYIWDIVQNIRETNAENVDLIENRNFIRECAEGTSKVAGLKPETLLQ